MTRPREALGKGGRDGAGKPAKGKRGKSAPAWEVARLYIGAGRAAKIRPADIVGAIANEVGLDSKEIGAIEIYDKFSLVDVPDELAEDVIGALRASTIKGRRVPVRRDREE